MGGVNHWRRPRREVLAGTPRRLKGSEHWWQQRLNRLHQIATCGCELTRDTEKTLRSSDFQIESLEHATLPGAAFMCPLIRGIAAKPG